MQFTRQQIFAEEKLILRALCARALPSLARKRAMHLLSVYHWQDENHRVIYRALELLRSAEPETIRENLAASATRCGFPDVDVEPYLSHDPLPNRDWLALIRSLGSDATTTRNETSS